MDMVRHHFHGKDLKTVFFRDSGEKILAFQIDPVSEGLPSVLRAPDDMVLQGIDISSSIG